MNKTYESEGPISILTKINDILIGIVFKELEKKEVPSTELLDTIKTITSISIAINGTFDI